jgi:hypothetical protein
MRAKANSAEECLKELLLKIIGMHSTGFREVIPQIVMHGTGFKEGIPQIIMPSAPTPLKCYR